MPEEKNLYATTLSVNPLSGSSIVGTGKHVTCGRGSSALHAQPPRPAHKRTRLDEDVFRTIPRVVTDQKAGEDENDPFQHHHESSILSGRAGVVKAGI